MTHAFPTRRSSDLTAYARDRDISTQDYNRNVSAPILNDTVGLVDGPPQIIIPMPPPLPPLGFGEEPLPIDQTYAAPGGIFCDPQIGCSDRILSMALSRSSHRHWSHVIRLT